MLDSDLKPADPNLINVASDRREWNIPRFQDIGLAIDDVTPAVESVLDVYRDCNIVIVGPCAGNGILEHAIAHVLLDKGLTDIQIVSTDLQPKEAVFKKSGVPEVFKTIDAQKLGNLRETVIKEWTGHPQNNKKTKLLAISRAWHHYFPEDGGKKVFEAMDNLLEPGEVFIDLPTSGSQALLGAMEAIHSDYGKHYRYHTLDSYHDPARRYFKQSTILRERPRIPRSLTADFLNRYVPDLSDPEAIRLALGGFKYILQSTVGDSQNITRIEYTLTNPHIKETVTFLMEGIRRGAEGMDSEVIYINDQGGSLADIIVTHTYPVIINTK